MKDCSAENIRNFVVAGHAGAGKTSLADLMLHKAGVVSRLGSVDQNTSVSDFRQEEQDRKSSLFTASLHSPWQDHHFFFCDTPGYADFCGEATSAIRVADAVLIVVDAAAGIGPGTINAWRHARDNNVPRAFMINGLDRDQADFAGVLGSLQESYGATVCVPFTLPVGARADVSGVVQVLQAGDDAPAELADDLETYREALMDTVAESDEELMMRYLEGEELSEAEIAQGLHQAISDAAIVPVFCGSVGKDVGIDELMNGIMNLFPAPLTGAPVPLVEGELSRDDDTATAFVYKSITDPFIGQLTCLRVFSGTVKSDSELHNVSRGSRERLGTLFLVNGKNQTQVDSAGPGELVAIPKLKNTVIGDTLSASASAKPITPISYSTPTMSQAIFPVKKGEEDKISTGLQRLVAEDPTLILDRNAETHQTVLSGMGDQHLAVVMGRLETEFKVETVTETPKVPYRETITGQGSAQYRHKKQTGGHGQFGEVHLRLEPLTDGEFEFSNEVVGGNIPKNYIPAVEKGVVETMVAGPLASCRVINIRAVVYDGKYHPVDSSEMAFKIAARGAFRAAMANAKPILLEPIMTLKILFPEEYMGDISGDLNSRRGRILGMDREEGFQVLNAEAPLAEMFTYSSTLRSMTQGRGSFEMVFERYDPVPPNLGTKIMAEAAKDAEEEE